MDKRTYEVLEGVERLDPLALSLVLGGELFGPLDHALDILLTEATLLVRDGDRLGLAAVSNMQR